LNEERVTFTAQLLDSHRGEIERLRLKCLLLAEQCSEPLTYQELVENSEKIIRAQVEKEIGDLLELDRRALRDFFVSLFSDEKTWLGVFGTIGGMIHDNAYLSSAAAIAALSCFGAKAFKQAAERRQKLKQSDFSLVYAIDRKFSSNSTES
jgi:hypothetical protein